MITVKKHQMEITNFNKSRRGPARSVTLGPVCTPVETDRIELSLRDDEEETTSVLTVPLSTAKRLRDALTDAIERRERRHVPTTQRVDMGEYDVTFLWDHLTGVWKSFIVDGEDRRDSTRSVVLRDMGRHADVGNLLSEWKRIMLSPEHIRLRSM
jgi:hypothetical protein